MAGGSGVFLPEAAPIALFSLVHHVGVATRIFHFTAPIRCKVVELQSVATAADATDKFTAKLDHVTVVETLITGSVVAAAATPVRITTMDAGKSDVLEAGHQYSVTMTYAGTAANVTGPSCTLWVKPANHNV